jgi:hypothetical protein
MCQVLKEEEITSVIGYVYCDDPAFAEIKSVAPIMDYCHFLHPTKSFREESIKAMKEFLEGKKREISAA